MHRMEAKIQSEIDLVYTPKAPDNLQNLDIPVRLVEDLVLRYF